MAILLAGLVPVSAGLAGALTGFGFLGQSLPAAADSHARYLSGLLLGIGLGVWWCALALDRRQAVFGALCALVAIGGLARLGGLLHGVPPLPHLLALVMELGVTPALWAWSHRLHGTVAKAATRPHP
ncbi:DUF4345 family protein [Humitalea sp. 24SJ18S-53]|uniref:DUF4345 family protein n=1 Tax=Humitalea sp. 24SJ18S-53 TaxID=3422307 RepID=UPI003D67214E